LSTGDILKRDSPARPLIRGNAHSGRPATCRHPGLADRRAPQMVIASLSAYLLVALFAWLMDQTERRGR
jgi:hypothetical protein